MIKNSLAPAIFLIVLFQCQKKPSFIKIGDGIGEHSSASFSDYCKSVEQAVSNPDYIYNRYGDAKEVIEYNERTRKKESLKIEATLGDDEVLMLEEQLNNPDLSPQERELIQVVLFTINGGNPVKHLLQDADPLDARSYIIEKSEGCHFLLLNEAHYTSIHRAFTASLLEDLWDKGYRYLAVEALASSEFELVKRGYPTTESGDFIQDPVFGNMVRKAIELGYSLVPYEVSNQQYGLDRELIQAQNIYKRTFQKDTKGKVIVHAGYSHISKNDIGEKYLMGYYLNKMASGQVLSVDQESMSFVGDGLNNEFYDYALENYKIEDPTIFLKKGSDVIDPVNKFGVDIQVYHPSIKFVKGRPYWLIDDNKNFIPLSAEIKEYAGLLIRAQYANEDEHSVPVDQFVIDDEKQLILPNGDFTITIVNCKDKIVSKYSLTL